MIAKLKILMKKLKIHNILRRKKLRNQHKVESNRLKKERKKRMKINNNDRLHQNLFDK
jgi:hypothetical protein